MPECHRHRLAVQAENICPRTHTHAPFSLHTAVHNMPSENHIKPDLAVKLEKAGWCQEPPVLRRELLHHSSVTEIHLRHKHAEMD